MTKGRMWIRTGVVTGGANGIGRASAECLAEEGVELAILDREYETAKATVDAIRAAGGKAHAFEFDALDEARLPAVFDKVAQTLGGIDMLLNNVGGSARQDAAEFHAQRPKIWHRVVRLSLLATLACSRQVAPAMRECRRGKIINIASDSALIGDAGQAEYAAAKAGVIGFTKSLARELAPFGITVNAVCPGITRTRALAALNPDILATAEAQVPLKRSAEPWEIGKAVAFLASGDADYITGHSLVVDGGRYMH